MHKGTPDEIKQALLVNRILWAALVMGVVSFAVVMMFVVTPDADAAARAEERLIAGVDLYVLIALLAILAEVPMGVAIRWFMFNGSRVDGVVPPQKYTAGNVIAWAFCEGGAFLGIIMAMVSGDVQGNIWPAGIAFVALLLLFPTGAPMRGKGDEYAVGPVDER